MTVVALQKDSLVSPQHITVKMAEVRQSDGLNNKKIEKTFFSWD